MRLGAAEDKYPPYSVSMAMDSSGCGHGFFVVGFPEFEGDNAVKSRLCITTICHSPVFFAITKFNNPWRSGRGFPWASVAPVISQRTSTAATSGRMNRVVMAV